MNSNSVHLIATDPPFNKGRDFHATPDSLADGASFHDRWSWKDDVEQEWVDQITDDWPLVMNVIQGSRNSYGDDMGAFLCYMAVRLLEMHRVLRDDGSIYLHCDSTAGHYLKELMDAIFGCKNFRNDIVWRRTEGAKKSQHDPKKWGRSKDNILYYVKSSSVTVRPYRPLTEEEADEKFEHSDSRGRYFTKGLTIFRRPSQGARPNLCYEWRGFRNKSKAGWCLSKDRLEEEYQKGNFVIYFTKKGKRLQRRKYEQDYPGAFCDDIWTDIPNLTGTNPELTGHPTQKPLALYERIVRASSNEGDIVLDPFAGCATTCVVADILGRQWVGIDIWDRAHEVVVNRLEAEGLLGGHRLGSVNYTDKPPERTDAGETATPFLKTKKRIDEPKGPKMSRAQMVEFLLEQDGCVCQACGREFDDARYLQLDHNTPRSSGGINHISNRVLLCGPCNLAKSDDLTLVGIRKYNRKNGYMVNEGNLTR